MRTRFHERQQNPEAQTADTTFSPHQQLKQTDYVPHAAISLTTHELLEIVVLCPTLTFQRESSLLAPLRLSGDPEQKSRFLHDGATEQTLSSCYQLVSPDLRFNGRRAL